MTLQKEICYKSLSSIVDMIRKLEISPVEVMEAFISRITTRNPTLNAFVYEDFDRAYDESKKSEKELTSGKLIGPLHGIPVAIKDLMSSKPGTIMTMGGIRALKNNVSNHRCLFTERIEKAGGIIIGKTNSPIMGFRGTCDNYLFGPTKNPYCLDKNSGGSSGGAAAAVADGMLPMAEGTDAGGSIRIPASWCGVYGYKASYGRVPNINRPNAFSSNTPFTLWKAVGQPSSLMATSAPSSLNRINNISRNGKKRYFSIFNNSIVADYIISKTFYTKNKHKFVWD